MFTWQVSKVADRFGSYPYTGRPARILGSVEAPNFQAAITAAYAQFWDDINPGQDFGGFRLKAV